MVLILTIVMVVIGLGGGYLLSNSLSAYSFPAYVVLPVFFYLLGTVEVFILTGIKKEEGKKLVNKYMLMRVVKILVSLFVLLIYWLVDKTDIRNFAIAFILYYMIFLMMETYFYLQTEKMLKSMTEFEKKATDID
jgi:hypothetical protein